MSRFSGRDLSVVFAGTGELLGVTSVSDSHSTGKTDVTGADTSDNFRESVLNLKTGTVSIDGHYDSSGAKFSGSLLEVSVDDGAGAEDLIGVTSISETYTAEKADVTGSDTTDLWREFVPGLITGSGSIEGHFDDSVDTSDTPPDMDWIDAIMTDVSLTFAASGQIVNAAAICDDVKINSEIEGSVDYSMAYTWNAKPSESGTGDLDRTWIGTTIAVTITNGSGGPTCTGSLFIDSMNTTSDIEGANDYTLNATWTAKPAFVE